MKILIAFATSEGQTGKIASRIARRCRREGHEVASVNIADGDLYNPVSWYDAVILAGSIHMGLHQEELYPFVAEHLDELNTVPTAFLSVSLSASDPKTIPDAVKCLDKFLDDTGLDPTVAEVVAGALKYTQYGFLKRFVMKHIAASAGGPTETDRDHENTDWDRVDLIIETFLANAEDKTVVHPSRTRAKLAS